jgi:hypothetical protein
VLSLSLPCRPPLASPSHSRRHLALAQVSIYSGQSCSSTNHSDVLALRRRRTLGAIVGWLSPSSGFETECECELCSVLLCTTSVHKEINIRVSRGDWNLDGLKWTRQGEGARARGNLSFMVRSFWASHCVITVFPRARQSLHFEKDSGCTTWNSSRNDFVG